MKSSNILRDFVLLTLDPKRAGILLTSGDGYTEYAATAALLLEMIMSGQIEVQDGKLIPKKSINTDNPLMNTVLQKMQAAPRPKGTEYWVSKLHRVGKAAYNQTLSELEAQAVVERKTKKILGLIPYSQPLLVDAAERDVIIENLRQAISSGKPLDAYTRSLVSLLPKQFLKKNIHIDGETLKRLKEEAKQNPLGNGLDKVMQDIETAIFISAIVAGIIVFN